MVTSVHESGVTLQGNTSSLVPPDLRLHQFFSQHHPLVPLAFFVMSPRNRRRKSCHCQRRCRGGVHFSQYTGPFIHFTHIILYFVIQFLHKHLLIHRCRKSQKRKSRLRKKKVDLRKTSRLGKIGKNRKNM